MTRSDRLSLDVLRVEPSTSNAHTHSPLGLSAPSSLSLSPYRATLDHVWPLFVFFVAHLIPLAGYNISDGKMPAT